MLDQTSKVRSPFCLSEETQSNILPVRLPVRVTFRVGKNHKNISEIKADKGNYNQAAVLVARKLYSTSVVERVVGINYYDDMPGYFQAYRVNRNREKYAIGDPFYISEVLTTSTHKQLTMAAAAD